MKRDLGPIPRLLQGKFHAWDMVSGISSLMHLLLPAFFSFCVFAGGSYAWEDKGIGL